MKKNEVIVWGLTLHAHCTLKHYFRNISLKLKSWCTSTDLVQTLFISQSAMEWYWIAAYLVNQAMYSSPHSLITIGCQMIVVMGFFSKINKCTQSQLPVWPKIWSEKIFGLCGFNNFLWHSSKKSIMLHYVIVDLFQMQYILSIHSQSGAIHHPPHYAQCKYYHNFSLNVTVVPFVTWFLK